MSTTDTLSDGRSMLCRYAGSDGGDSNAEPPEDAATPSDEVPIDRWHPTAVHVVMLTDCQSRSDAEYVAESPDIFSTPVKA